jgi:hypothetical protein
MQEEDGVPFANFDVGHGMAENLHPLLLVVFVC